MYGVYFKIFYDRILTSAYSLQNHANFDLKIKKNIYERKKINECEHPCSNFKKTD